MLTHRWKSYDKKLEIEKAKQKAEAFHGESPLGFLYRYEERHWSVVVDAEMEIFSTRVTLELMAFPILKKTSCGHTIRLVTQHRDWRFVSDSTLKRYALPTVEEAALSFVKRKQKQITICKNIIREAETLIEMLRVTANF